jgi:hypothetical protein
MALCVAFVDGALEREAQLEFQRRMATEPDLAAATQALLETDEMLRKLEAGTQRKLANARRMRPWMWVTSLAAAAALLLVLGRWMLAESPAPSFEVAAAPSFESPLDYIASRPELAGLRPRGVDVLRGENQAPNIQAEEFLAKAAAIEADRQPLASRDIRAGYFVVPIDVSRAAEVVIYAFPKQRAALHLPASEPRGFDPLFWGQVPAGRHVLPAPRFVPDAAHAGSVRYERGFLVSVGVGELDVLVGVRRPAATLGTAARYQDSAEAERALSADGFVVRHLRVREPGD